MKILISFTCFFVFIGFSIGQISNQTESKPLKPEAESIKPIPEAEKILDQKPTEIMTDTGVFNISKNEKFDLLLQEYLEQKKVMGYRIQLFAGNKKLDALKMKVDFMKLYPEINPEIIYQQPNFKVRVGNYRNRLEAQKFLALYKIDFTSSFLVKDEIKVIEKK
jgi:hypothetical protein